MTKLDELINWFYGNSKVLVALSGGVDSALVAYAAHKALGDFAIAVTADYKTLAKEELESAEKICAEIGIKHVIINYSELENLNFIKNDKNRCFHCRSELSEHLKEVSVRENADIIVDGTNLDDLVEYRPGIKALKENDVKSPLVDIGFTKKEIRECANKVGLTVYDRPSNSCLASRIPWGQEITAETLARIEMGEIMVKQFFEVKQVRVRDLNGTAKIEVDHGEIHLLSDQDKLFKLVEKLKQIGFNSVLIDPEGYKPGKINVIID
jgi:pyridinium-3,5-biscarboxylic acid mononucleotide sulfurtransferase